MRLSSLFKTVASISILVSVLYFIGGNAKAAPVIGFDAGNIISDSIFYNKDTMSVVQIQNFLDTLIPACDTNGTQPSGYGSLTNAQYAQQIGGWPGPRYVCSNKYFENPTTG